MNKVQCKKKVDESGFQKWWEETVSFYTDHRHGIYRELFQLGARTKDLDYAEQLRDFVRQWDRL